MFSLICAWINGWVNNHEAGDLRRERADYDVIGMYGRSTYNQVLLIYEKVLSICNYGVLNTFCNNNILSLKRIIEDITAFWQSMSLFEPA